MTTDAIIMAILNYGFYLGGFAWGFIKILKSEKKTRTPPSVARLTGLP